MRVLSAAAGDRVALGAGLLFAKILCIQGHVALHWSLPRRRLEYILRSITHGLRCTKSTGPTPSNMLRRREGYRAEQHPSKIPGALTCSLPVPSAIGEGGGDCPVLLPVT